MAKKETAIKDETTPGPVVETPVNDDEAAAFARVEAMAAQESPQPGETVTVEPEPIPPVNAAESMAAFMMLAGGIAGQVGYRRTAAVWNPETCRGAADRIVPVLRKYPWGAPVLAFFEKGIGAEEMALVVFLAPVGVATFAAIKADMTPEAEPEKPASAPVGGASQATQYMKEMHGHAND